MIDAIPTEPSLIQYGIVGTVFAAVFAGMTVPMLRALLAQNTESLGLLRRAVEINTAAVTTFARLEVEHREARAEIRQSTEQLREQLAEQAAILRRLMPGS